jgi:hypothetical protein
MGKRRVQEAGGSSTDQYPNSTLASLGLWAYLIIFGGSCLALYFQRIHYIPELNWKDALTELFVLSILGGCTWILFGLLLFLPGAIWSRELIWDPTLCNALCFDGAERPREPCLAAIWKRIGMPFAAFICCVHVGLYLGRVQLAVAWPAGAALAMWLCLRQLRGDLGYPRTGPQLWRWLLTAERTPHTHPPPVAERAAGDGHAAVSAVALDAPAGQQPLAGRRPVDTNAVQRHSRLWKYMFWFGMSIAIGSLSLSIDFALSGIRSSQDWQLSLICTAVIICANLGVALRFKSHRPSAIGISVVAGLVLFVAGERLEGRKSLLCRAMETFGVGEDTRVAMVVKASYRDVLCGLQIPFSQVGGGPPGALLIRNVSILSRLGVNYFARAGDRQFQLPKTEVLSWAAVADSSVTLRQDDGDADIVSQAGRVFVGKIVFANKTALVATPYPQALLLARWEREVEPVLVHLEVCGDQRCLYLVQAKSRPTSDPCAPGAVQTPAAAANPKDPNPKAASPKDAKPKDPNPKDASPKDPNPKDASPKDFGFKILGKELVKSELAWNEQLSVWQVSTTAPLCPGEYGLLNRSSGDVAAFSVSYDAKQPTDPCRSASTPSSPGTPARGASPASSSR